MLKISGEENLQQIHIRNKDEKILRSNISFSESFKKSKNIKSILELVQTLFKFKSIEHLILKTLVSKSIKEV